MRTSIKYLVIYRHKEKYTISEMCRFFDVSRSGYYDYVKRMEQPDRDLPLAEQIRAAGAGLGGVLTQTGLGTIVEKGKEKITVDGKEYLLEKPVHADVAIIGANISDEDGNLVYKGTSQNFCPMMATAADMVIVEPQEIVPTGSIAPENVKTPGIFVDYIIKG